MSCALTCAGRGVFPISSLCCISHRKVFPCSLCCTSLSLPLSLVLVQPRKGVTWLCLEGTSAAGVCMCKCKENGLGSALRCRGSAADIQPCSCGGVVLASVMSTIKTHVCSPSHAGLEQLTGSAARVWTRCVSRGCLGFQMRLWGEVRKLISVFKYASCAQTKQPQIFVCCSIGRAHE